MCKQIFFCPTQRICYVLPGLDGCKLCKQTRPKYFIACSYLPFLHQHFPLFKEFFIKYTRTIHPIHPIPHIFMSFYMLFSSLFYIIPYSIIYHSIFFLYIPYIFPLSSYIPYIPHIVIRKSPQYLKIMP